MTTINISKVSSKGQIVIPKDLRERFKEGSEVLFIEQDGLLILKPVDKLYNNFKSDILFAKETEAVYDKISKGEGNEKDFDEFIEEMKKW